MVSRVRSTRTRGVGVILSRSSSVPWRDLTPSSVLSRRRAFVPSSSSSVEGRIGVGLVGGEEAGV